MFFYHTNIFLVDVLKSCRFPKKATNPKKLSIWWYEFELVGTLHHVTWVWWGLWINRLSGGCPFSLQNPKSRGNAQLMQHITSLIFTLVAVFPSAALRIAQVHWIEEWPKLTAIVPQSSLQRISSCSEHMRSPAYPGDPPNKILVSPRAVDWAI